MGAVVTCVRGCAWSRGACPPGDCAQARPRQPPFGRLSIPVVDAAFLRPARARGMPAQVWTVDKKAGMARLLDLGVDGILSDRVTVLKRVFEGSA
ncbi:MAG: glycerophosphodiester phosphodiesterase family protein [Gammaproteobacteria bacterium]|nr:glycerophosphodiester phosphodiesterase family protein [Gammaproteobacteria bacterium]